MYLQSAGEQAAQLALSLSLSLLLYSPFLLVHCVDCPKVQPCVHHRRIRGHLPEQQRVSLGSGRDPGLDDDVARKVLVPAVYGERLPSHGVAAKATRQGRSGYVNAGFQRAELDYRVVADVCISLTR